MRSYTYLDLEGPTNRIPHAYSFDGDVQSGQAKLLQSAGVLGNRKHVSYPLKLFCVSRPGNFHSWG